MNTFYPGLDCFGLSAEQFKKEISVCKVLDASVTGIVQLLSTVFLQLMSICLIIATSIDWWAMDKWLQSFSYHVSISWRMFALAGEQDLRMPEGLTANDPKLLAQLQLLEAWLKCEPRRTQNTFLKLGAKGTIDN